VKHASFFSGVGGLDLGFERAGIRTVSVSEIDPYANAVLAERFPDAPNLGSIKEINADDIPEADIWSGGFPCQDLSKAGKRAGFEGERSSLAFDFINLMERRRPKWVVLENVAGVFTSNQGRDFGRLIGEMEQLGYGVAWRILDARYFGVAQRRRRVFIVGSLGSDRAGEVLFDCGSGCGHDSSVSHKGEAVARTSGRRSNADSARGTDGIPSQENHADRMRAVDGLARRMDDRLQMEDPLRVGNFELWDFPRDAISQSLNARRARDTITYRVDGKRYENEVSGDSVYPSLDSHRYRCCGNGVVAPVAEWVGKRMMKLEEKKK
jgi:DNA (cytosine-5)-methyltransferase 1